MEAIGSWPDVLENVKNIEVRARRALGSEIEISVSYCIDEKECLVSPVLNVLGLKGVSKSSIFRVYLEDEVHCSRPVQQLLNWYGDSINPSILSYIKPKNIIRVILGVLENPETWSNDYVVVLKRLSEGRLLVSHIDCYSVHDENFIFVVDKAAVLEIPLEWSGNENLVTALASLTPPREQYDEDQPPQSVKDKISSLLSPDYQDSIMMPSSLPLTYTGLNFLPPK